jgi:predicted 3-demethylubiquinone-9 3-methyltransferase (glyoxalase superfamily)
MKISDAKKDIEIELTGTSHNNAMILAEFTMTLSRPIQAASRFNVYAITTEQGKTGVKFSEYSPIAKALKAKQNVLITLPDDAIQFIRTESENHIANLKAEAAAKKATVWYWNNDNEYYALHITPDISMDFREDLEATQETLEKNQMRIWDELVANSKPATKQSWMHDRTTWMEVPAEIVEKLAQEITEKKNAVITARKEEYTAKETAAFEKARETGEKTPIRRWTVPCSDSTADGGEEECSTDIVVEYAMPDGTKKTEQHHTW